MKNYLLRFTVLVCTLLNYPSIAQNVSLEWGKSVGRALNGAHCELAGLVIDKYNNSYSAGSLASYPPGPVDFGSGIVITTGLRDAFIAKHDAQGNCIRVSHYPSVGTFPNATSTFMKLFLGADSHLYATGQLQGSLGIAPGDTVRATSGGILFFTKIDTTGNFVWLKYFERLTSTGGATLMILSADSQGNVYITGSFSGTVDFDPDPVNVEPMTSLGADMNIFVCKLDQSGNYVWAKQIGGSGSQSRVSAQSIVLDAQANLYITGQFNDEVDFNPAGGNLLITNGKSDPFVLKMSPDGNFVWVKQFEGTNTLGTNYGNGIVLDANNNVIVSGRFNDTITFATGTQLIAPQNTESRDMFVAKLDSSGNFIWAKHLGGTGSVSSNAMIADDFNNIYTTGYFLDGNVDFDPGPDPYILTPAPGNMNTFVSKLDQNGNFLYTFQLEGNSNQSYGLAASPGNVYLAGIFNDTIDLDPTSVRVEKTSQGYNARSIYLVNYRDCPELDTLSAIQGNDTVCAGGSYIFSVPSVSGAVSYTWQLPAGWAGYSGSDSITVTAGTTGGDITVIANGVCDTGTLRTFSVHVNDLTVSITENGDTLSADDTGITTWQWYLDGNAIDQATGSSHVAVANGDYTVVVTDRLGCTDTSDVHPVTHIPESVSKLTSSAAVRIYPNPVTHTVYVSVPVTASVQLSGIEGKTLLAQPVQAGTDTPVDLSALPSGIYILNINDECGHLLRVEKLVKE